jgi:diguanylate cyclase (GGDEF)-like protein
MSIQRQLIITLLACTLLSFAANLAANLYSMRGYLAQQLSAYSRDGATALALGMSQQQKDLTTLELLLAAQFDTGQYQSIRLLDPHGAPLISRQISAGPAVTPDWFNRLIAFDRAEYRATVTAGWQRFGEVVVQANPQLAYAALWRNVAHTLGILAGIGLLTIAFATGLLQQALRPLRAVVAQAEAISERRFVSITVPRARELHAVVLAMNRMVAQLQSAFAAEAARVETLMRSVNTDTLTGLATRSYFGNWLDTTLAQDDQPSGALYLLRLRELPALNQQRGRSEGDDWVRQVAAVLQASSALHAGALAGRLNGADLALFVPELEPAAAEALAGQLQQQLQPLAEPFGLHGQHWLAIGVGLSSNGESAGALLGRADQALAQAEASGINGWRLASNSQAATSSNTWQQRLQTALHDQHFFFDAFAVVNRAGQLEHREQLLRLRDEQGTIHTAGSFLPLAARLGQLTAIDTVCLQLAQTALQRQPDTIAVLLSGAAVRSADFQQQLRHTLASSLAHHHRLIIEVTEHSVIDALPELTRMVASLKQLRCRVGIRHVGQRLTSLPRLHGLGVDHIKIDASLTRNIHDNPGGQALLEALVVMAHKLEIAVYGEGVTHAAEAAMLWQLGFDGVGGRFASSATSLP